AVRRKIAAVEVAGGALIEAEEEVLVDPLEVVEEEQRLAHADVGEDRPARVEHPGEHALWQAVRQRVPDDAAVARGRKVVGGLPAARILLGADVVEALLERLQMRVDVSVVVEAHLVEVPEAAIDREV